MTADHPALLDTVYKFQRHIYDVTRKYFLFGRDTAIKDLLVEMPTEILEVGCGTARNLEALRRRGYNGKLFGIDASQEMLKTAQGKLGANADIELAFALAEQADYRELFGRTEGFEVILFSYSLSMIPDWQAALANAEQFLRPGGKIYVVDFWDFSGYPTPFRKLMEWWLAKFHVSPRLESLEYLTTREALQLQHRPVGKDYGIIIEAAKLAANS